MSEQELTPDGNPIYRHSTINEENAAINETCKYLDEITAHVETHIGEVEMVFHEIVSEFVHVDLLWIKPHNKFPYHALVTSGMSDKPMTMPADMEASEGWQYAELMILLPASWDVSEAGFEQETNYWPVRWLKMLARLPHQYNTWLGYGHTVPNGPDAAPFAENTGMGCMMVLPAMLSLPEDFHVLTAADGNSINFYALLPLYREEMELKMEQGSDALLDLLDEHNVTEVIDINRVNTCK